MKKIKEKVFVNKEEKNKALKNNFKRMQYWQWMYSYVLECVHNQIEFKLELKVQQMSKELIYCRLYNKLEEKFLTQNSEDNSKSTWVNY